MRPGGETTAAKYGSGPTEPQAPVAAHPVNLLPLSRARNSRVRILLLPPPPRTPTRWDDAELRKQLDITLYEGLAAWKPQVWAQISSEAGAQAPSSVSTITKLSQVRACSWRRRDDKAPRGSALGGVGRRVESGALHRWAGR